MEFSDAGRFAPLVWFSLCSPVALHGQTTTDSLKVVYVRTQVEAGEFFRVPLRVLAKDSNGPRGGVLVRVVIDTGGGYLYGPDTATTNAVGIASFSDTLALFSTPGVKQLVLQTASASLSVSILVVHGPATRVVITRQPSSQIVSDSVLRVQPIVRALDNAGNAREGVEIQSDICYKRTLDSLSCTGSVRGGALLGNTVIKTDVNGEARFNDLVVQGPDGYYRLVFRILGGLRDAAGSDTSGLMLYDADRVFDRSYVVISAIKSIAGRIPSDEFFDVRFRYRYHRNVFALANIDVALSNRGTDTVRSNQQALTEAAVSLNWSPLSATRLTPVTEERERSLFFGVQLRVFNTLPYWGSHLGSVEHAGSPFTGSSATIGVLHRMADTLGVVGGDTLVSQPWNLFADFFLTSSSIPFFKALNLRGGILLPLKGGRKLDSRIVVSVPVGTINLF